MRLSDVLKLESVRIGYAAYDKDTVLRSLAQAARGPIEEGGGAAAENGRDEEEALYAALVERERLATTGIGGGVALPHAWASVPSFRAALLISADGLPFDTLDGAPVYIALAIFAPLGSAAAQIRLVLHAARVLSDQGFCVRLRGAESQQAVLDIWQQEEERHES
jgi:mannitol/fructose-specific phosphotransferase system IIA component (Ntr-type)